MIFRDDDISKHTDITTIMRLHDLFIKHDKIHTVTILMEDLWESRAVWEWLVTTPNLDIALHGWTHIDHSLLRIPEATEIIDQCLTYWDRHTARIDCNIPLKVFYPPWNKVGPEIKMACEARGLEVNDSVDKSLVTNFHWWTFIGGRGLDELEEMLKHGPA